MPSALGTPAAPSRANGPAAHSPTPSPGRRLGAFFIDVGVVGALIGVAMLFPAAADLSQSRTTFRSALPYAPSVYLLFRDAIAGRSIGKLATGLVVWDERTARPAGFMDSVIRNAPFAVLLLPLGGPLVQGLLWPFYLIKLVAAMTIVFMFYQVLRHRPRRILEGPATTRVIDARAR